MAQAADFGAAGDGVTDDTDALQHAIDESVGKSVCLVVTTGLLVRCWCCCRLWGVRRYGVRAGRLEF